MWPEQPRNPPQDFQVVAPEKVSRHPERSRSSGAANDVPATPACKRSKQRSNKRSNKIWITLFVLSLSALLSFTAFAANSGKTTDALPPGPMQAKATTACTECHEARIILQQRLSKAAWTKEVDKMTKWGALVDPADRDALIDYLSANFGPDQPPYEPPRSATEKGITGKKTK
jgi:hypothetical protein